MVMYGHSLSQCKMTALMKAADGSHMEVVKVLLQAGADINIQNEVGIALFLFVQQMQLLFFFLDVVLQTPSMVCCQCSISLYYRKEKRRWNCVDSRDSRRYSVKQQVSKSMCVATLHNMDAIMQVLD